MHSCWSHVRRGSAVAGAAAAALGAVLAFAPAASALDGPAAAHGGPSGAVAHPMNGAGHHDGDHMSGPHSRPVIINNLYQIAGGDIFNAGRDNLVGNGDGGMSGEIPGEPTPTTVVKLEVSGSVFPGLTRVSQEGSGDYPQFIPPAFRAFVPVSGASGAVYESAGGAGHVRITVAAGNPQPDCTADGNLSCMIDFRSAETPRPLLIEGR